MSKETDISQNWRSQPDVNCRNVCSRPLPGVPFWSSPMSRVSALQVVRTELVGTYRQMGNKSENFSAPFNYWTFQSTNPLQSIWESLNTSEKVGAFPSIHSPSNLLRSLDKVSWRGGRASAQSILSKVKTWKKGVHDLLYRQGNFLTQFWER